MPISNSRWTPQPKVAAAGGIGTVLTGLLAWALPSFPPGLTAALAALVTSLLAYLIPNPRPADPAPADFNGPPTVVDTMDPGPDTR